jgi:hypothetical protein
MTPNRFTVPEAKIIELTQDRIAQGQSQLVDVIKTLVYKTAPSVFDLLNYDDDETFLEPLLFSWFTSNEPCVPLEQILFGYIITDKRPADIEVYADANGIIYLPRLGYLFTNLSNEHLSLSWAGLPTNFFFKHRKGVIAYKFENILWVKETSIEICRTTHPLLNRFFIDGKNEAVPEDCHIQRGEAELLRYAFSTWYRLCECRYG